MSASPIADITDPLLPWASSTEIQLHKELQSVETFVELGVSGDELERLTRFYGTFLTRQLAAGADAGELLATCPALTAVTLLARAARLNEIRELPREYWAGFGLEPTPQRAGLIEDQYARILAAAGLDPMDVAATGPDGELGRVFVHVGVATDWLPELIELIDARRMEGIAAADAQEEAQHVVAELANDPVQLGPLCATLPAYAARLVQPMVRIVRHAAAHPADWEETLPQLFDPQHNLGLPPLVLEDVIEEMRERPAGTRNRRYQVGAAHLEDTPRLRLDVTRNRVVLRLPELPLDEGNEWAEPELRWRVDFDGSPAAFRTGRADRPGAHTSEILDIPVRHPLREMTIRETSRDRKWVVPMVDSQDPILVFTQRGMDLTRRATLHHSQVWVVTPTDAIPTDIVRDIPLPILVEVPVKTWPGWVIRLVDLSEALSLHAERSGQHRPPLSSVRAVDPRQRLRFVDPDTPLPAIITAAGKPVYNENLVVEFPETLSGDTETWFLSVSSYAGPGVEGENVLDESPLEVPAEGGEVEIFDFESFDFPWVGEYHVRLRGPRNESFRHEFALVEGMEVDVDIAGPSAQTRLPVTGGFSPVTVRVRSGEKPFHPIAAIQLREADISQDLVVETDEGDAQPLRVMVPRLRYQLPLEGEEPMWRGSCCHTAAAWLDLAAKFRVRPGTDPLTPLEKMQLVIRDRHGAPVRTLKLVTVDNVTWSADLAALSGVQAVLSAGSCELEFVDPVAGKQASVRLATFVAAPEWSVDYDAAGAGLRFAGVRASAEGGSEGEWYAWVWPLSAPWEPARVVQVAEAGGVTPLPEELVAAGSLAVQLFAPDRGGALRAPVVPGSRARVVEAPGFFGAEVVSATPAVASSATGFVAAAGSGAAAVLSSGDGLQPHSGLRRSRAELSRYLAGESEEIPHSPEILPTLWDVQAGWLRPHLAADTWAAENVELKLRSALVANPRASVHAMSRSLVATSDRPAQFILSGLVHSALIPDANSVAPSHTSTPWIWCLELLGEYAQLDAEDDCGGVSAPAGADVAHSGGVGSGHLAQLVDGVEPAEDGAREQRVREVKSQLREVGGAALVSALETGRDQSLESAAIDATTVQVAHMDPAQQAAVLQMLFGDAGVVPGALAEENSRLLAVMDTFEHRPELGEVLQDPVLMRAAVAVLRRLKSTNRQIYRAARVRFERLDGVDTDDPANRWALAPVVSMVFALATRMHAHGHLQNLGKLPQAYAGWAELSRLVPRLVTGDIVLADAMVLGVCGG